MKLSARIHILILYMVAYAPVAYAAYYQDFIKKIVDNALRPIVNIMFIAATVFFIYGIIEYIAGADNEKSHTTGRDHMLWGIIGLIIMTSVYFILSILSSIFYTP